MKSKYSNTKQKIYDDYKDKSDHLLLEMLQNENKYLYAVIDVIKIILDERKLLPERYNLDNQTEQVHKGSEESNSNIDEKSVYILTEKDFFSIEGRITRSAFWLRYLLIGTLNLFWEFIYEISDSQVFAILNLLIVIAIAITVIIQGVKRMHDVNKSGWFFLIPIYNIILSFTDGTPGSNDYGNDPKRRVAKPEA